MTQTTRRNILITGCSSGIGLYCAKRLHAQTDWRVFATARAAADVTRLKASGLTAMRLDLTDAASIRAAVDEMLTQTDGKIDALFNNGAYGQPGAMEDLPIAALREQFETNVFGTQALTNAVLPVMRRAGGGRVIQNSSVLGFVSLRYRGAYNASKYALEGLSDTMRLELAGSGVRVILIEPGPITSDFRKNANKKFGEYFDDEAIAASAHADYYRKTLAAEGKEGATHLFRAGDGATKDESVKASNKQPPFTLGPDAVYDALLHALTAKNPKARYRVTFPTHLFWWCKRLLPTKALDALLRRAL